MSEKMLVELSPSTVATLTRLMQRFGEDEPTKMLGRAVGLADLASKFLNEDGAVTVVDPQVSGVTLPDAALVDLVFTNSPQHKAKKMSESASTAA